MAYENQDFALCGPGGIGKTTLLHQVQWIRKQKRHPRADRFVFVDLLSCKRDLDVAAREIANHIFNSKVRRCMELPINNINATPMMDEGKVLIVNLRGLSDPVQRMFGSLITVLFEQTALNRPEEGGRRAFNYYLDEFTDYCANEGSATSLARILSRCRKRNFRALLVSVLVFQDGLDQRQLTFEPAKHRGCGISEW